jgi:hypothetical protein
MTQNGENTESRFRRGNHSEGETEKPGEERMKRRTQGRGEMSKRESFTQRQGEPERKRQRQRDKKTVGKTQGQK